MERYFKRVSKHGRHVSGWQVFLLVLGLGLMLGILVVLGNISLPTH